MMEDKKIERLFQEKLRDFEVQPSPLVWENIESKLTKKKKRRILPIWWLSSGIASIIIIGLLLFPEVINTEKKVPVETNKTNQNPNKNLNIITTQQEKIEEPIIKTNPTKKESIKPEFDLVITKQDKELVVYSKKASKEEKVNISAISLKGLQADKKIAMENDFYNALSIKIKERGLEKKDFIAEVSKENEKKEDQPNNSKWSVSPVFGITTSQSFTKASAIDSKFNENEISNPETISYGVSFAYQLNNKLSVKSGVQIQNMSFDTQNVILVSNTTVSNNLENISFSNSNSFLYISASGTEEFDTIIANNSGNANEATLEQNFNYIEFPLELKYQLFTSEKIQTSFISGFSTLFLTRNDISAQSSIFNRRVGEANNLNSINFSANFGVDIEFSLSKKIRLNINPMFKTQLNTFSDNSTNFRPYIIGVYSGLRYNF